MMNLFVDDRELETEAGFERDKMGILEKFLDLCSFSGEKGHVKMIWGFGQNLWLNLAKEQAQKSNKSPQYTASKDNSVILPY
ncbi:hypothetical protein Q3G72_015185 [Acer saccharum]|nr:hypothetical protein Q3G72_015185 [Acer saccharum]